MQLSYGSTNEGILNGESVSRKALCYSNPSLTIRTTSLSEIVTWTLVAIFFSETLFDACSFSPIIMV